MTSLFAKTCHT